MSRIVNRSSTIDRGFRSISATGRRLVRGITRRADYRDTGGVTDRDIATFAVPADEVPERLRSATNDMERAFYDNSGRDVHKWTHYLSIYGRHFEPFRGKPVRMLEIGVFRGGSMDLWRRYFGDQLLIVGIDLDPACADLDSPLTPVRIGSQSDPEFLASVVAEFGPFDIVLDDGSHVGDHQRASFSALFDHVRDGGLYIIEDLHTSYWRHPFAGGYRLPGTGIEFVKDVIDEIHGWYHDTPGALGVQSSVTGVHVYDSIVVFEKGVKTPPVHIIVPGRGVATTDQ